jgi:hypothetical protein
MSKCYLYPRTSSDDRGVKLGIDVQRQRCLEFYGRQLNVADRKYAPAIVIVTLIISQKFARDVGLPASNPLYNPSALGGALCGEQQSP